MNKALERLAVELKLPLIPTLIILVVIPLVWVPDVHVFLYNLMSCPIQWLQGKATPVVISLSSLVVYLFSAHINNAFNKNPQLHCPSCGQYTFKPLPLTSEGIHHTLNSRESKKRCESCGYCGVITHNK